MLGDKLYEISQDEQIKYPITAFAWKPTKEEGQGYQKLLGSCLDGSIVRWTQKCAASVEHIKLTEEAKYHAIDYGGPSRFCIAGNYPSIEIWDEERMVLLQSIRDGIEPAHTNKIFTCRFVPDGTNMIYSGGWDNAVRFWDCRTGEKAMGLLGPQINGETVDVSQDMTTLVTGGGTLGEGIQLWDMRNLSKPTSTINWETGKPNPMVYACKFVPDTSLIIAGSRDSRAAKCFDFKTGNMIKEFTTIQDDCYALDINKAGTLVAFGDGNGWLNMENIVYQRVVDE